MNPSLQINGKRVGEWVYSAALEERMHLHRGLVEILICFSEIFLTDMVSSSVNLTKTSSPSRSGQVENAICMVIIRVLGVHWVQDVL